MVSVHTTDTTPSRDDDDDVDVGYMETLSLSISHSLCMSVLYELLTIATIGEEIPATRDGH